MEYSELLKNFHFLTLTQFGSIKNDIKNNIKRVLLGRLRPFQARSRPLPPRNSHNLARNRVFWTFKKSPFLSRGNSRENRLSQFESKSIFFLYVPARQYIRIMPKWGLITRLGSKVMSIAVIFIFWCPTFMIPTHFFVFETLGVVVYI